uniref:Uncharacterized protein n=1 Tax=viral metagenome TaxID=1070528 RepID=A0A6M3J838_9ZZZZ
MGELILAEQGTASVPAATMVTLYDDGIGGLYKSSDDPSGVSCFGEYNIYRLGANGTAIGPGIADFYGPNSAIALGSGGVYMLEFYCWYTKTVAGAVTFTVTNTAVNTNMAASCIHSAGTGIQAMVSPLVCGSVTQTTATMAFMPTPSITTAVNNYAYINVVQEGSASTNVRLRATEGTGTITPLRGSYYTCRRLAAGTSVGTFVA